MIVISSAAHANPKMPDIIPDTNVPQPFSDAVNGLFEAMSAIVPPELHPPGVIPMPTPGISGTSFFPGGSGLFMEGRARNFIEFPVGGVMVLGTISIRSPDSARPLCVAKRGLPAGHGARC
jgi:hypothetical protein